MEKKGKNRNSKAEPQHLFYQNMQKQTGTQTAWRKQLPISGGETVLSI
jgi:hypothetical protein